ncbi:penicillin-binding transpeptidase domain-containing protein [Actinokineospora inagensis]|uniref:penicillin-binding transpeptidase domain-containing protein n=1 Tax=Actinokineospora inagensis TaxID=103730 RepID=UPI0004011653|nr:penicillin-binding transpeptidase domain-containing protein [Actinokineospora inagensis]
MSNKWRRWVLAGGAIIVVAIVGIAVFVLLPGGGSKPAAGDTGVPQDVAAQQTSRTPAQVTEAFLSALSMQRPDNAAQLTDDPAAAESALTKVFDTLRPEALVATALTADGPAATFQLTWQLAGAQTWKYTSSLALVQAGAGWLVRWTPTVVHPKLTPGTQLAVVGDSGQLIAVTDRDSRPLMTWQGNTPQATDPKFAPMLSGAMSRTATPQNTAGSHRVALVDQSGKEIENLFGAVTAAKPPLRTTVSTKVQAAAQAAVDSVSAPAYLVAIQPSTGDILAVAQNATAGSAPKALNGLYPPGSTFKVVTASAIFAAGKATPDTVVPCPGSEVIGTRTIRNADFELGDVPLHQAFAQSCNTTFASLAAGLPLDALPKAAAQFGFAADFEIPGLMTQTGRVDVASGVPQQVENSIGQGTVQASPFGLALMAATVAKGGAVTPQLFYDAKTVVKVGYKGPSGAAVSSLRAMMREVVTSGRGKALNGYGGVAGKTGTAQFGDGSTAHGWFAGYRGDVAFAVLVENSGTAGVAVSVAGAFLGAV